MEKLELRQSALENSKCFVWTGSDIVGFEDKEKAVEHVMKLCPEGHKPCWSLDESDQTDVLKFEFKKIQSEQEYGLGVDRDPWRLIGLENNRK